MRDTLFHSYRMACICSLIEKGINRCVQIMNELNEHKHGYSKFQIFTDLEKLVDQGCLTKKGRVYALTRNGKYHLDQWRKVAFLP